MHKHNNISSKSVPCPICKAGGYFFKNIDNHHLYKCSDCASLFYYPFIPLPHDINNEPFESPKWYVERGANLLFYSEVIEHVQNILTLKAHKKMREKDAVLEVGCSYGFLIDMAASLFHWNVTGADPSPCAKKGAQDLGIEI
ncbi:MAG: class I SAM-dependent methyltransferase, partial [Planctomycetota bacterium]